MPISIGYVSFVLCEIIFAAHFSVTICHLFNHLLVVLYNFDTDLMSVTYIVNIFSQPALFLIHLVYYDKKVNNLKL